MKEPPKISIIMPLYNAEKYLKRALESVLSQTYKNYELIIIDGGSTDNTMKIIDSYRTHITYSISENDEGYGDALNKGIKVATGDYYIILAGDDFLLKRGLENFVNDINGSPDVYCGNMLVLKEKNIITRFNRANSLKELEEGKVMAHPATFFKLSTLRKFNGYDTNYKINCDRELILRMYKSGATFQVSDSQTYISVFVCGGMSVQEKLKDSILNLGDLSQGEAVSIKYGIDRETAKRQRKKVIYKKMAVSFVKKVVRGTRGRKLLYMLDGQKPLSRKEIVDFAINIDDIE